MRFYHGTATTNLIIDPNHLRDRYRVATFFGTTNPELALAYARHRSTLSFKQKIYTFEVERWHPAPYSRKGTYTIDFIRFIEAHSHYPAIYLPHVLDAPDAKTGLILSDIICVYDMSTIKNLRLYDHIKRHRM